MRGERLLQDGENRQVDDTIANLPPLHFQFWHLTPLYFNLPPTFGILVPATSLN